MISPLSPYSFETNIQFYLQTISLLSYLASYKGIWGPHLIIVPTSCIVNWEIELKRFCPAFKVLCYYGSAKRRKELRQGWTKVSFESISFLTSLEIIRIRLSSSADKLAPCCDYFVPTSCARLFRF